MGLLWEMIQHSQIEEGKARASRAAKTANDSARRITQLETELASVKRIIVEIVKHIEPQVGRDIDGDGKIGS